MLMEWSSLRDFLVLAEHGSVSRASKLLGLSQPALSRRLLRLEEDLDAPLFLRSPRGLALTAAGDVQGDAVGLDGLVLQCGAHVWSPRVS